MENFIATLNTKEFREAHNLPNERITTPNIAEVNPDWKEHISQQWWDSEALAKGTSEKAYLAGIYLEDHRDRNYRRSVYADFRKLGAVLLSIGGSEHCFPKFEEDLTTILERGKYYGGRSKMEKGELNQCHANCVRLWQLTNAFSDRHICTGYALSRDGMWRQHSWIVEYYYAYGTQRRCRIIETTAKRIAYYGFEMTDDEAIEFCYGNY